MFGNVVELYWLGAPPNPRSDEVIVEFALHWNLPSAICNLWCMTESVLRARVLFRSHTYLVASGMHIPSDIGDD